MATPSEKLAQSLDVLQKLQNKNGLAVIKADELSRTHKERLLANGFLEEVMKGWFIATRPDAPKGDTTSWYTSFWNFVQVYLSSRFDESWCLSPDQSLRLLVGNRTVPSQLLVRSPKARNKVTQLIHNTSILDMRLSLPAKDDITVLDGINVFSLESGLIAVTADFFARYAIDARACLVMVKDASVLLAKLLEGGHSVIAGRLAGAFRNIGNARIADNILKTMKSAGYEVREEDPFSEKLPEHVLGIRETSPYASRIKLMWHQMRGVVIENFPSPKVLPGDIESYMKELEEHYAEDAYHSLSIEGYRVTPGLIERVRGGNWNPDGDEADREARNAMAARGYYQAFQSVKESIRKILAGENPGEVADMEHGDWYRELFAPSVTVGLLKPADLAGYRNGQVYIKGSMHTPLNPEAVRDAIPALFELLRGEDNACVRAVLGHFIFVYIHPYMDGNGRIARFLFNTMLVTGGYSWTVVPVERRDDYMAALERASVDGDIRDFARFLGGLVNRGSK